MGFVKLKNKRGFKNKRNDARFKKKYKRRMPKLDSLLPLGADPASQEAPAEEDDAGPSDLNSGTSIAAAYNLLKDPDQPSSSAAGADQVDGQSMDQETVPENSSTQAKTKRAGRPVMRGVRKGSSFVSDTRSIYERLKALKHPTMLISASDARFCIHMTQAYGDDYDAMTSDPLNSDFKSAASIKQRIDKFTTLPPATKDELLRMYAEKQPSPPPVDVLADALLAMNSRAPGEE